MYNLGEMSIRISQRSRKDYLNLIYIGILKGQRERREWNRTVEKIVVTVIQVVLHILVLHLKMNHRRLCRMMFRKHNKNENDRVLWHLGRLIPKHKKLCNFSNKMPLCLSIAATQKRIRLAYQDPQSCLWNVLVNHNSNYHCRCNSPNLNRLYN